MSIQTQPLEVKDFSGGITDETLGANPNRYRVAENLLIEKYGSDGKLFTRPGSSVYLPSGAQIPLIAPPTTRRVSFLGRHVFTDTFGIEPLEFIFAISDERLLYASPGGSWNVLTGPTGNLAFNGGYFKDLLYSFCPAGDHVYVAFSDGELGSPVHKIFVGSDNLPRIVECTLPYFTPCSISSVSSTKKYLYRVLFRYKYTTSTKTYIDRGETFQFEVNANPASYPIIFSSITVITNGLTQNRDVDSLEFVTEWYRTTDGGQNFYLVKELKNGLTTWSDTMDDVTLLLQTPLYTEGGLPERADPPSPAFMGVVNNTGFYARASVTKANFSADLEGRYPSRLYQSVPGDIDGVPRTFFTEFNDHITGFSSFKDFPLVFCLRGQVFRCEGMIQANGAGNTVPKPISNVAGCINHLSIVQTEMGVFWAGIDGIYFTDAYQCIKVSSQLNTTYKSLTASDLAKYRFRGKYNALEKRIYWTVQDQGKTECERILVLDLNFGISEEMPFTFLAGGETFTASALDFEGENLIRGDATGYVFKHTASLSTDLKIVDGSPYTSWPKETIRYRYQSVATDFGTGAIQKFIPSMSIQCRNDSNLSLAISSLNDDGKSNLPLKGIRFRGNIVWGDASIVWGDPTLVWNKGGVIDEKRRFPGRQLRTRYKQITLENAKTAIYSSDSLGLAAADGTLKTLTRGTSWPDGLEGYAVAFEADGFTREYPVVSKASGVLTLSDGLGTMPTGTDLKWVIRGYPKGEKLFLLQYAINFAAFGQNQSPFRKGRSGEVGDSV